MVNELSVAFPEMPPIRDFCAIGMMAPTALQDVKSLYDGQPSAAASILKKRELETKAASKSISGLIWKFLVGDVSKFVVVVVVVVVHDLRILKLHALKKKSTQTHYFVFLFN
jgi:hypothetical protein